MGLQFLPGCSWVSCSLDPPLDLLLAGCWAGWELGVGEGCLRLMILALQGLFLCCVARSGGLLMSSWWRGFRRLRGAGGDGGRRCPAFQSVAIWAVGGFGWWLVGLRRHGLLGGWFGWTVGWLRGGSLVVGMFF
ncbi:unnamed protein product [Rhodiola kirilowii]